MEAASSGARDFGQLIRDALRSQGGITEEELAKAIEAYGVRVDRARQHLVEQGTIVRALDRRVTPPVWRYWLAGDKPANWEILVGNRAPQPEPEAPEEVLPAAAAKLDRATEPEPAAPASPRPRSSPVLDCVNEHPEGLDAHQVAQLTRKTQAVVNATLSKLAGDQRIARKGARGAFVYFPMGPRPDEVDEPVAIVEAPQPVAEVEPKPKRAPKKLPPKGSTPKGLGEEWVRDVEARGAQRKSGKKAGKPRGRSPSLLVKMREELKALSPKGLTTADVAERWGPNGSKMASYLVEQGEWRRRGAPKHFVFFHARDPQRKPDPRKGKKVGPRKPRGFLARVASAARRLLGRTP